MPGVRPRRAAYLLLVALGVLALMTPATASASVSSGTYSLVTLDLPVSGGGHAGGYLVCPTGMRIVTGGAYWHRSGHGPDPTLGGANLEAVAATFDAKGEYAAGYSDSGGDLTLTIVALCLTSTRFGAYKLIHQDFGIAPNSAPNNTGGGKVSCGSAYRVITGGAFWHRPNENPDPTLNGFIQSSAPTNDKHGWFAYGVNDDSEGLLMTVTALCLKSAKVGSYNVKTLDIAVAKNTASGNFVPCQSGFRAVAGGAYWHRSGSGPNAALRAGMSGISATTDGLGWYGAGNAFQTGLRLHIVVMCIKPT